MESNDHIESAMTLSRVERNDPALRVLTVSNRRVPGSGLSYYWPNNSADLARIGDAIGANTQLQRLDIIRANALMEMSANSAPSVVCPSVIAIFQGAWGVMS
mmetsp:Transcript_31402/g.58059  ORF Transcript_31402/g.58059 Transcript_31402/m.58059 type:complete len:102 (-) Transcript_31402:457-762(-)